MDTNKIKSAKEKNDGSFSWLKSIRLTVRNGYMCDEDAWRIQEYFNKTLAAAGMMDSEKIAVKIPEKKIFSGADVGKNVLCNWEYQRAIGWNAAIDTILKAQKERE